MRSARKEAMRSSAFSFLEGFGSVRASCVYWPRVRVKEVKEAVIWPRREGVGGVERERSRFREVDCLRAVLKREFWVVVSGW